MFIQAKNQSMLMLYLKRVVFDIMMKRLLSVALSITMLSAVATGASARGKVRILLNGEPFVSDTEPFIEHNRTYVPVRAIFEAVGASVMWDGEKSTAIIVRQKGDDFTHVAIQKNMDYVFINSEKVKIDAPAFIENNRMHVPLRVIMTALGEKVEWDGSTGTVSITTE